MTISQESEIVKSFSNLISQKQVYFLLEHIDLFSDCFRRFSTILTISLTQWQVPKCPHPIWVTFASECS